MGKYSDFIRPHFSDKDFPKVKGTYGCQQCYMDMPEAWFDEKNGVMFWICPSGHRSEIKVNV